MSMRTLISKIKVKFPLTVELEIGTEYIKKSLYRVKKKFGPFTEGRIAAYVRQVAQGVQYLHSKDIEATYAVIKM